MKPAQLQALEEAINEKIRAHVPVTVQLLSLDDPGVEKVHLLILYLLVLKKYCPLTVQSLTQKCVCEPGEESRAARRPCRAHSDR